MKNKLQSQKIPGCFTNVSIAAMTPVKLPCQSQLYCGLQKPLFFPGKLCPHSLGFSFVFYFFKNSIPIPLVPSMPCALIDGFVHTAVLMNRLQDVGRILLCMPQSKFPFTFITSQAYKAPYVFLAILNMFI